MHGFCRGQALPGTHQQALFYLLVLAQLRTQGTERLGADHAVQVQAAVLFRISGQQVYSGVTETEFGEDNGLNALGAQPVRAYYGIEFALLGLAREFAREFKAQTCAVVQQEQPRAELGQSVRCQIPALARETAEEAPDGTAAQLGAGFGQLPGGYAGGT